MVDRLQVFDLCDKDGNGFIGKSELSNICEQFSDGVVASALLDSIKVCLGSNHDDHISFEEFKAGFEVRLEFSDCHNYVSLLHSLVISAKSFGD